MENEERKRDERDKRGEGENEKKKGHTLLVKIAAPHRHRYHCRKLNSILNRNPSSLLISFFLHPSSFLSWMLPFLLPS